jgi:hypothetical protein
VRLTKIAAAAAVAALPLFGLAAPAGASNIGTAYSTHLSGYQLVGNGGDRFRDAHAQVTAPAETPAVAADSLVDGFTSGDDINGGFETGIGLVFNDTAHAPSCHTDQWVVEAGSGNVGVNPMPLPTSDLSPLLRFGMPVCVNGGSSRYLETYYNASSHFIHFLEGPSAANNDEVLRYNVGYHNFYTVGFGVDTTNGTVASNLTSGSVAGLGTAHVTQYNGHKRLIDTLNVEEWVGTLTGGAPSVANPVTLQPTGLGAGFSVIAS